MISPLSVFNVSLRNDTYITNGVHVPSANLLAFATSDLLIKLYDANTGSFLRDVAGHNSPISEIASFGGGGNGNGNNNNNSNSSSSNNNESILISAQRDTGIMITDLRQPQAAQKFVTDLQSSGLECFGMDVSPLSGGCVALSAGSDIHLLDPRMNFKSMRTIPEMHTDVITKLRFVTDSVLASGGEDFMFNVMNAQANKEGDLLLSSVLWDQAPMKISVIHNNNNNTGGGGGESFISVVGSCEGSFVQPIPNQIFSAQNAKEQSAAEWVNETKISRPPLGQYLVDFASLPPAASGSNVAEIGLLVGERPGFADNCGLDQEGQVTYRVNEHTGQPIFPGDLENNNNHNGGEDGQEEEEAEQKNQQQKLSAIRVTPGGVQPDQRVNFASVHRDDIRVVISNFGENNNKIVTAGEDGVVAIWDLSRPSGNMQVPCLTSKGGKHQQQQQKKTATASAATSCSGGHDEDEEDFELGSSSSRGSTSAGGKEPRQRQTKGRDAARGFRPH